MTDNYATAKECRPLFELMNQVKELAPWEWMEEMDIFGVQGPDAEEPDYVSVMGMAGEHFAVALYPGDRALTHLLQFEQIGPYGNPLDLLLIPQFQASFEDRNTLTDKDRKMLKELGLKYRGRNAWPQLRAQQPACVPWYIESADVSRMVRALEQLLVVAPRVKENPDVLIPAGSDAFLVRKATQQGDHIVWEEIVRTPSFSTEEGLMIELDSELMDTVYDLPEVSNTLEVALSMMPSPVSDDSGRPYFPYMFIVVESTSGMVMGMELLSPLPSLQAMWAEIPNQFLEQLAKVQVRPQVVHVNTELLASLLSGLEQLGIEFTLVEELPGVEAMQESLFGFLGGGLFEE
ncbi:MAG: hypothetical protein KDE58_05815 [Caldilineaceae bacterium]|nr:hypothetical protein [Caldilineaceae bacterium]